MHLFIPFCLVKCRINTILEPIVECGSDVTVLFTVTTDKDLLDSHILCFGIHMRDNFGQDNFDRRGLVDSSLSSIHESLMNLVHCYTYREWTVSL